MGGGCRALLATVCQDGCVQRNGRSSPTLCEHRRHHCGCVSMSPPRQAPAERVLDSHDEAFTSSEVDSSP